jgi:Holliday junction DNA helicase RuvA
MISRIRGTIRCIGELSVLVDVQGVGYEVLVAPSILRSLEDRSSDSGEIEFVTFHYQQLEPGRGIPVLIGFLNEVEREFFLRFISVSGVGPRAALKALTQPISLIAKAIDDGDMALLKSLPGIGEQRAREIIAKLQGKVGKFGLIQSREGAPPPASGLSAVEEEAVAVLVQLEYRAPEAREMVRAAMSRNSKVKTSEDVLNEIYRQQRLVESAA